MRERSGPHSRGRLSSSSLTRKLRHIEPYDEWLRLVLAFKENTKRDLQLVATTELTNAGDFIGVDVVCNTSPSTIPRRLPETALSKDRCPL